MYHKLLRVLIGPAIIASLIFFEASCKKEAPPWASAQFAGNFSGTESCLLTGSQSNTINIVVVNATQVSITNLYGQSKALTGNISHDTCTILPQICDTFVMQGMMIISADSLSLSVIASSFGKEDKCNAVLVKQ